MCRKTVLTGRRAERESEGEGGGGGSGGRS